VSFRGFQHWEGRDKSPSPGGQGHWCENTSEGEKGSLNGPEESKQEEPYPAFGGVGGLRESH